MTAGRPSDFTQDLADSICERIAAGESLSKICRDDEAMPHRSTVYDWLARQEPEFKAFADNYARAVEDRAESLAEEILTIADDDSGDYGFKEGEDKDGKGAKACILPDNIQRARLRVDSRKWIASKLFPKKYGDKVQAEHTGAEGGPITFAVTVNYVSPNGSAG